MDFCWNLLTVQAALSANSFTLIVFARIHYYSGRNVGELVKFTLMDFCWNLLTVQTALSANSFTLIVFARIHYYSGRNVGELVKFTLMDFCWDLLTVQTAMLAVQSFVHFGEYRLGGTRSHWWVLIQNLLQSMTRFWRILTKSLVHLGE